MDEDLKKQIKEISKLSPYFNDNPFINNLLSNFLNLFENKINRKFNSIKNGNLEFKEEFDKRLNIIQQKFDGIITHLTNLESLIKNLSQKIIETHKEIKEFNNIKKNKQVIPMKTNKNIIDIKINDYKGKKITDFIKTYKKNELGFEYYEPYEIENENEEIISSLKNNIVDDFLPDNEICENKTLGLFLYSVGGISRKAVYLSHKAYLEIFNEYKKFLENNRCWLTLKHDEDRRNLSIWAKKCLKEKEFFEYYSVLNINEINNYKYTNDNKTNEISFILFKDLIRLYTKCILSIPIVETEFTNNNCKFEPSIMTDMFYKKRDRQVNFCYLPCLKSNGKLIRGGNYYVFTFKKDTFQKKGNLFDKEIVKQNSDLYSIQDYNKLQIEIIQKFNNETKDYEIEIETIPSISIIKPHFILYKNEGLLRKHKKLISNNETGIFKIEEKNIKDSFNITIYDYKNDEIKSVDFKMEIE